MYYGVNFSGAEFGVSTDYAFNKSSSQTWFPQGHYDYFKNKGFNFIRLPISWDKLQPTLKQDFDATYAALLKKAVTQATSIGQSIVIDIHNYARKNGKVIGSPDLPISAFADLWSRLALLYKDNALVLFGLCNEPHDMATSQWVQAANAASKAIRDQGAMNQILVAGNYWSGSTSWLNNEMVSYQDPLNNYLIEIHCYLNSNGSGATEDVVSPTILKDRLTPIVNWCRKNNKKFILGEFSTGTKDPNAKAAIQDGLTFLKNSADVCAGFCWWSNIGSAPPNDPWTPYAINPSLDYKTEDSKVAWLTPFLTPTSKDPSTTIHAIRKTTNSFLPPSDQGHTFYFQVPANQTIPPNSYPLSVLTRTTYADLTTFVDQIILSNPSKLYDMDWREMYLDLRGHTLKSFWDCNVEGTQGIVKITPTTNSRTVLANGRNAFGLVIQRQKDPSKNYYQVLVNSVVF